MWNNFVVTELILDKFTLQEILSFRSVCREWKLMIDEYLKYVNTLIISEECSRFFANEWK